MPDHVTYRPKMGFPVPFATWIREESGAGVRDILLESRTRQRGYFNPTYVERLLNEHQRGQRDCFMQIWMLLQKHTEMVHSYKLFNNVLKILALLFRLYFSSKGPWHLPCF